MNVKLIGKNGQGRTVQNAIIKRVKIDPFKFGDFVSGRRIARRIRQSELGHAIFCDRPMTDAAAQSRISRLECGKIKIDDHIVNRVAAILDEPVSLIHKECSAGFHVGKSLLQSNLSFNVKLLKLFPTLDSYIKIINNEIESGDKDAAVNAFRQMCHAANRSFDKNTGAIAPPFNGTRR